METQTETVVRSLGISKNSEDILLSLIETAKKNLGDDLRSIILFGSGAERRLRPTSDMNLLFVLSAFDRTKLDPMREQIRIAYASLKASAMFLINTELASAADMFAVKFADMVKRHIVLYGEDCLSVLSVSRESKKEKLIQILLNLKIRMRERYVMMSLREEQLARVIAEAAGPLRGAASIIDDLSGKPGLQPKEALASIAVELGGKEMEHILENISTAREKQVLPAGVASDTLFAIMDLVEKMIVYIEEKL